MNSLKKALTKEDPRKYHKSKIEISAFNKIKQWDEVEFALQKKHQKRSQCSSIEASLKTIIQSHFSNGQLKDIGSLLKELSQKYKQFNTDGSLSQSNAKPLFAVLNRMVNQEQGALLRKYLTTTIEKLQNYLRERKNKEKQKCLNQFNKLINTLKPNLIKEKKEMKELPHSTSATNLRIRVTKEEYQFDQQAPIRKKKSLDFKNKSKGSSNSYKQMQGVNKLQMFLKESNLKLVKTKIEYDYSAIFQASKSNIQSRNKTTVAEAKVEKEAVNKATQGKKNQGFVFYRPTSKKI